MFNHCFIQEMHVQQMKMLELERERKMTKELKNGFRR